MADIIAEINTIGDLITPVAQFTRLYKQDLPKVYVANTVGIRWQGDRSEDLTAVVYGVDRTYQIIYFGKSEIDCLNHADKIRSALDNAIKTKLRGLDGYMTLSPFAYSAPFKTDTDGVYAIVGILPATVYVQRPQEKYEKMRVIDAEITTNGGDI